MPFTKLHLLLEGLAIAVICRCTETREGLDDMERDYQQKWLDVLADGQIDKQEVRELYHFLPSRTPALRARQDYLIRQARRANGTLYPKAADVLADAAAKAQRGITEEAG